jgi:hypothetical protein
MGYIGASRSERSQQAINNGLLVYSQLSAWQKRAADQKAVLPCEWHHTGKFYFFNFNFTFIISTFILFSFTRYSFHR